MYFVRYFDGKGFWEEPWLWIQEWVWRAELLQALMHFTVLFTKVHFFKLSGKFMAKNEDSFIKFVLEFQGTQNDLSTHSHWSKALADLTELRNQAVNFLK